MHRARQIRSPVPAAENLPEIYEEQYKWKPEPRTLFQNDQWGLYMEDTEGARSREHVLWKFLITIQHGIRTCYQRTKVPQGGEE